MANIPCSNPELCGVKSHRPGTYAPCHQKASYRPIGSARGEAYPPGLRSTPKPATSGDEVSDYIYTPTTRGSYGDSNWVPVTDLAIELSREHGVIITPDGPYSFSFEGIDSDDDENPSEITVSIHSKRDKVWIEFDGEGADEDEVEAAEFHDKYEAAEWMNQIFEQYGKQIAVPAEPETPVDHGKFDAEKHLEAGDLPETLDEDFTFTFDYKDIEGEFYVTVTGFDDEGKAQYDFELDPDGQYDEDYREVVGELVPLSDEEGDYSQPESIESFDKYFQNLIQENYADEVEKARNQK